MPSSPSSCAPAVSIVAPCSVCVRSSRCLLSRLDDAQTPVVEYAVPVKKILVRQAEPVRQLLTIKVGLLVVRRHEISGLARAVAVVGPGQTLGLHALSQQGTSMFEVAALSKARLCARVIPSRTVPAALAVDVLTESARFAEMVADWAVIARLPTALQRVEAALRRLAAITPSSRLVLPDRDELADLTACAPETVSRAIGVLIKEGRVRRGERQNILYLSPPPPLPTHTHHATDRHLAAKAWCTQP